MLSVLLSDYVSVNQLICLIVYIKAYSCLCGSLSQNEPRHPQQLHSSEQLNSTPHRTSKNRAHRFDIAGKAHTMTFGPKAPVQFMSFLHPTSLTHLRVRASASLCMWAIPFFRSSSLSASPLFAVSIWWGDEKLNLRKQRNIIWALKSWVLKYHRLKLWNITSWGVDLVHQNMAVKIKKLDSEGTCSPFLDSRSEATCKSLASLRVNYAGWIIGYRLSHAIT